MEEVGVVVRENIVVVKEEVEDYFYDMLFNKYGDNLVELDIKLDIKSKDLPIFGTYIIKNNNREQTKHIGDLYNQSSYIYSEIYNLNIFNINCLNNYVFFSVN